MATQSGMRLPGDLAAPGGPDVMNGYQQNQEELARKRKSLEEINAGLGNPAGWSAGLGGGYGNALK